MNHNSLLVPLLVVGLAFAACGKDDSGPAAPEDPNAYVPPSDVFMKDYDPAQVVVSETKGLTYAADQLVVVLETPGNQATLDEVAALVGGTKVGQIPALGFYQLQISPQTEEGLDTLIANVGAVPRVRTAMPSVLMVPMASVSSCYDPEDDNYEGWNAKARCAMWNIQYYQMSALMEMVRESMPLSDVRVANLEPLNDELGAFDDTDAIELGGDPYPSGDEGHGTRMAGVIAASWDDGGVVGIASEALREKLTLYYSNKQTIFPQFMAHMFLAADIAQADVVNMSFGFGDGKPSAVMDSMIREYTLFVNDHPDTLFISAAGNSILELTGNNYLPGGVQLPNTITVGGTASCDTTSFWVNPDGMKGSNYGTVVDIAAPSQRVPVLAYFPLEGITDVSGGKYSEDGTSIASPMVAALAAILKSVDPGLDAAAIRNIILTNSFNPMVEADDYGHPETPRMVLIPPISQALIDLPAPGTVLDIVDAERDGEWDTATLIVNRLCGGATLEIDGHGPLHFPASEDGSAAVVSQMGTVISLDSETATLGVNVAATTFALGVEHAWSETTNAGFQERTEDGEDIVSLGQTIAGSGFVIYDRCVPLNDSELAGIMVTLEVEGRMAGELAFSSPSTSPPVPTDFSGTFVLPFIFMSPTPDLQQYVSKYCKP